LPEAGDGANLGAGWRCLGVDEAGAARSGKVMAKGTAVNGRRTARQWIAALKSRRTGRWG